MKVGMTINDVADRLSGVNNEWTKITCQICGGRRWLNIQGHVTGHVWRGTPCPGGNALPLEKDSALAESYLENLKNRLSDLSGIEKGSATRIVNNLEKRIDRYRHYNRPAIKTETVIAGGGPAGLAVAACLKKDGHPFILLEKSDKIGAAWHNHYDRLHLHTDRDRSELPYFPYPETYPRYPSRRQVIKYLENYARHFELQPRFNQAVESADFENGRWNIRTEDHLYLSHNFVVATGYNNQPHIPSWPGMEVFEGNILHSSEYSNGKSFKGQKVLVVGFGNSGGEIAMDLCEYKADVSISVRSAANIIPRELLGIPILAIAIPLSWLPAKAADLLTAPILRFLFGDLQDLGLHKASNGPFTQIEKEDRIPLIDVGTVQLIRDGDLKVMPGIEGFTTDEVEFTDGTRRRFEAVVLATGFKPGLGAFLNDYSPDDKNRAAQTGLYFCGFKVTATGVLREISIEAKDISQKIIER